MELVHLLQHLPKPNDDDDNYDNNKTQQLMIVLTEKGVAAANLC